MALPSGSLLGGTYRNSYIDDPCQETDQLSSALYAGLSTWLADNRSTIDAVAGHDNPSTTYFEQISSPPPGDIHAERQISPPSTGNSSSGAHSATACDVSTALKNVEGPSSARPLGKDVVQPHRIFIDLTTPDISTPKIGTGDAHTQESS